MKKVEFPEDLKDGIWVYNEILHNDSLNGREKYVLSVYKCYTDDTNFKYCTLTNEELGKKVGIKKRQVINIKNHLKELGLIKNIGHKIYYIGEK